MAKRTSKSSKDKMNRDLLFAFAFLLFLLTCAAIYFQARTGFIGKVIGGFFFGLFGFMTYFLPFLFLIFFLAIYFGQFKGRLRGTLLYILGLFLCALFAMKTNPGGLLKTSLELAKEKGLNHQGPGLIGAFLHFGLDRLVGNVGIIILCFVTIFFFVLHLANQSLKDVLQGLLHLLSNLPERKKKTRRLTRKKDKEDSLFSKAENILPKNEIKEEPHFEEVIPVVHYSNEKESQLSIEDFGFPIANDQDDYQAPDIELLKKPKEESTIDEDALRSDAKIIEDTLYSFGIDAQVVSVQKGPTVTQFELSPPSGVKVSRITNLADDLALALAASDIRMEAPIPGKSFVGIEVPNKIQESVLLREIIQSREFQEAQDQLPVGLGKSIEGNPIIAKLAKMPHLLIAGATGSGKSVCINTLIVSLLYKYSPTDLRMILIDPKVVELSVYNDIPHLLIPVVTDSRKASKSLNMAVQEMERRFKLFSEHSVRDIAGYREKRSLEPEMENLPYILVIIDELSDLMMVCAKDVEASITRLAQMARACGIHLVIATQRPSVDVITGTIKANIPSRISFQVSSQVDSRTILDMSGAEKLVGKGDMLYYPSNFPKPKRIQGCFISDHEVHAIAEYLKGKHDVQYDSSLLESIENESNVSSSSLDENFDELMGEVIDFIRHEETVSISGLQRRFRIGYARAGRIVDDLERIGYISQQDGAKPREVLLDPDHEENKDEFSK